MFLKVLHNGLLACVNTKTFSIIDTAKATTALPNVNQDDSNDDMDAQQVTLRITGPNFVFQYMYHSC